MKRYQVYLNADSVSVLDDFERVTRISRSKLIRDAVDQLSSNIRLVLSQHFVPSQKGRVLSRLVGLIPRSGSEPTDFARRSDREYLGD